MPVTYDNKPHPTRDARIAFQCDCGVSMTIIAKNEGISRCRVEQIYKKYLRRKNNGK